MWRNNCQLHRGDWKFNKTQEYTCLRACGDIMAMLQILYTAWWMDGWMDRYWTDKPFETMALCENADCICLPSADWWWWSVIHTLKHYKSTCGVAQIWISAVDKDRFVTLIIALSRLKIRFWDLQQTAMLQRKMGKTLYIIRSYLSYHLSPDLIGPHM